MNIHELRKKIKEYADAYYNEDAPLVTDEEYDALMHELRRLEAENPEAVAPDSPTQVVGGKRVLGIPVEHKVPMLSLLDVFSDKEVKDFLNDVWASFPDAAFSVERKIDGLSLSLVYEDGVLIQASTRGWAYGRRCDRKCPCFKQCAETNRNGCSPSGTAWRVLHVRGRF